MNRHSSSSFGPIWMLLFLLPSSVVVGARRVPSSLLTRFRDEDVVVGPAVEALGGGGFPPPKPKGDKTSNNGVSNLTTSLEDDQEEEGDGLVEGLDYDDGIVGVSASTIVSHRTNGRWSGSSSGGNRRLSQVSSGGNRRRILKDKKKDGKSKGDATSAPTTGKKETFAFFPFVSSLVVIRCRDFCPFVFY